MSYLLLIKKLTLGEKLLARILEQGAYCPGHRPL